MLSVIWNTSERASVNMNTRSSKTPYGRSERANVDGRGVFTELPIMIAAKEIISID